MSTIFSVPQSFVGTSPTQDDPTHLAGGWARSSVYLDVIGCATACAAPTGSPVRRPDEGEGQVIEHEMQCNTDHQRLQPCSAISKHPERWQYEQWLVQPRAERTIARAVIVAVGEQIAITVVVERTAHTPITGTTDVEHEMIKIDEYAAGNKTGSGEWTAWVEAYRE